MNKLWTSNKSGYFSSSERTGELAMAGFLVVNDASTLDVGLDSIETGVDLLPLAEKVLLRESRELANSGR